MIRFLPIQAKIAIAIGLLIVIAGLYFYVRNQGYQSCKRKYLVASVEQKDRSRKEIVRIESKEHAIKKELSNIPANDCPVSNSVSFAIDSVYDNANSK